jgi:Ohr subfamily peroxiredoxin
MASLYSTKVTASGGRHGSIRSEDGLLDLKLALPRALGGRGDATNPEQLFPGGYAACFENAILHVSRVAGHRFADDDIDVAARIDLGRNGQSAIYPRGEGLNQMNDMDGIERNAAGMSRRFLLGAGLVGATVIVGGSPWTVQTGLSAAQIADPCAGGGVMSGQHLPGRN